MEIIIALAVIGLLVLFFIAQYNRLIRLNISVDESFAQIEVQLKRRSDLIPNLVETVKGYAKHEQGTFDAVVTARAKATTATTVADVAAADGMLTQALRGDGDVIPVLQMYEVKKGDRYLLCSDGLSGVLTEKEIKVGLKKSDKDEAVKFLVDATYVNGAPDNVTVLIADISDEAKTTTSLIGAAHD